MNLKRRRSHNLTFRILRLRSTRKITIFNRTLKRTQSRTNPPRHLTLKGLLISNATHKILRLMTNVSLQRQRITYLNRHVLGQTRQIIQSVSTRGLLLLTRLGITIPLLTVQVKRTRLGTQTLGVAGRIRRQHLTTHAVLLTLRHNVSSILEIILVRGIRRLTAQVPHKIRNTYLSRQFSRATINLTQIRTLSGIIRHLGQATHLTLNSGHLHRTNTRTTSTNRAGTRTLLNDHRLDAKLISV